MRKSIERSEQAIKSADLAEAALISRLERFHSELAELEAQAIDRKAEKVAKDFEEHTRKVNALLAQIEELDGGGGYVSKSSVAQIMSSLMAQTGKSLPADFGPIKISCSEALASELRNLREQAAQIRNRQVRSNGKAQGHTLEELLEQMRGPGIIAPAESSVRA